MRGFQRGIACILVMMAVGCTGEQTSQSTVSDADAGGGNEPVDSGREDGNCCAEESPRDSEMAADTAIDVGDATSDTDTGRMGEDPRLAAKRITTLKNFAVIGDHYAVTGAQSYKVRDTHYFWLKVRDISDPKAIELTDVRIYNDLNVVATVFQGDILLATHKNDNEGRADTALLRLTVEEGRLKEVARNDGSLLGDEDPYLGSPLEFVSSGDKAVLSTTQQLASVSLEGREGAPVVEHRIDRDYYDEQRRYKDQAFVLTSGDVGGLHDGISVWSFDTTNGEPARVGHLTGERYKYTERWWDFSSNTGHLYLGGGLRSDSTESVDLTTPTNPSLAASWKNKNYFSRKAESTDAFEVVGERLYWSRRGGEKDLYVYDISQPDKLDQVAALETSDLPIPSEQVPQNIYSLAADGDTLYMGYEADNPPELPAQTIIGVDRMALE